MQLDTKRHVVILNYYAETRIINSSGKSGARIECQAFASVCCRPTGIYLNHRAQMENRKPHRIFSTASNRLKISKIGCYLEFNIISKVRRKCIKKWNLVKSEERDDYDKN